MAIDGKLAMLWAKTGGGADETWHPLVLHLLDVAACAEAVLSREPQATRDKLANALGLDWEKARPWLLLLISCHDLGKACPGFQYKWKNISRLETTCKPNTDINHAFVSQVALTDILSAKGWCEDLADLAADAVGCHHGERASPKRIHDLRHDRRALGERDWERARQGIADALFEVFDPVGTPVKLKLSGPEFFLLAGLTSFADWIGSSVGWFPFGVPEDCGDLHGWFNKRRACAGRALDEIGWGHRTPLSKKDEPFEKVFGFPPRPLQRCVSDVLSDLGGPSIILVEAPMGEGKTEAAFYAHLQLQRRFGHRGMYVGLPTRATGNAMFGRTLKFLISQGANRALDLQLLHGATFLNDQYQNLRLNGIQDPSAGGDIRAGEWFTHKKRALLSEYGVGTADQALMPILPIRHHFVRMWGLSNRVVVFDEIHAYDTYTSTLLVHMLKWLLALGSSVILPSATLPPSFRRKLASETRSELPEMETEYPRVSVFRRGERVGQIHFDADPARRLRIQLAGTPADPPSVQSALSEETRSGGMALALVNTVQRAQDLYRLFPEGERLQREGSRTGKRLADGTELYLFHARFPADRRQKREDQVLETFGGEGVRTGRKILIATQVVEQSLDIDFDVIITDLAPVDLVLQRAGRLWRHRRGPRPVQAPVLIVAGLAGERPPAFGHPLWWDADYREDLLIATWALLKDRHELVFPDEIDILVQAVYDGEARMPEGLRERMDKATLEGEGQNYAKVGRANRAIIGFPDDASWNCPERYVLYDEDEPGVHWSLMAKTRLGEDSVIAIPLFPQDGFQERVAPSLAKSKEKNGFRGPWGSRAKAWFRN